MVEVFIWRIQKPNIGTKYAIGHASMRVSGTDSAGAYDQYISWWPTGTGSEFGGSPAIENRAFQADCDDEGHQPERRFRFENFFDERKILDLWADWRKNPHFQMMFKNCSTTVRRMLCGTGMAQFVQFTNFCSYDVITVPEDIEHYCNELEQLLKARAATFAEARAKLPGRWTVKVSKWTWIYDFDSSGGVRWRDPNNGRLGQGSWSLSNNYVLLSWAPASKTTEHWDLPIDRSDQEGRCLMAEGDFDLEAAKDGY